MPLTRTNTKRWVAVCEYADCEWESGVIGHRENAAAALAAHLLTEHRTTMLSHPSGQRRKDNGMAIKQAATELPEQEGGEKLGDYVGKLCVFDQGSEATDDSQYGTRSTVHAELWVFDPDHEQAADNGWAAVGSVIVWFRTVGKQIMEALPDQAAGILVKGTDRNVNEWALTPVPKTAKNLIEALKTWDPSF